MTTARIARLTALPPDLAELEAVARSEGLCMVGSLLAEGMAPFAPPGCALFGGRDGEGPLLAIGGITRDPYAAALRMRRFYVHPGARRLGLGRALVSALLDHAAASGDGPVRLRAPHAAFPFWEACGFVPTTDPHATHLQKPDRARRPVAS